MCTMFVGKYALFLTTVSWPLPPPGSEYFPHFLGSLRLVSNQQDNHRTILVWSTSPGKYLIGTQSDI